MGLQRFYNAKRRHPAGVGRLFDGAERRIHALEAEQGQRQQLFSDAQVDIKHLRCASLALDQQGRLYVRINIICYDLR